MGLIDRMNALEFFHDEVRQALANQKVSAGKAAEFYLVNLLVRFVEPASGVEVQKPLAVQLAEAFESDFFQQRQTLQRVGDTALLISGFFADSLRRKLVDVDYYVSMGYRSYRVLSQTEVPAAGAIFAELAERFVLFVDVLTEVSERASIASNSGQLQIYERWLKTGSPRSGRLLAERGIVPNASFRKVRIQ